MPQGNYLVWVHRYGFRAGEPAKIIGEANVTPKGLEEREVYRVQYSDGFVDEVPKSESLYFELISEADVRAGRIPEIIH